MGFSITWCAVRDGNAQKVLDQLGLSPTGEAEDVPESLDFDRHARHGLAHHLVQRVRMSVPAARGPWCHFGWPGSTDVPCRGARHGELRELWRGGTRQWWISHEGEDGPKGLATEGDLPDCFAAIRREMEDAQLAAGGDAAGVDHIFDIPLRVAQTLVGFRHDEVTQEQFVVLSRSVPKKGLFGETIRRMTILA